MPRLGIKDPPEETLFRTRPRAARPSCFPLLVLVCDRISALWCSSSSPSALLRAWCAAKIDYQPAIVDSQSCAAKAVHTDYGRCPARSPNTASSIVLLSPSHEDDSASDAMLCASMAPALLRSLPRGSTPC